MGILNDMMPELFGPSTPPAPGTAGDPTETDHPKGIDNRAVPLDFKADDAQADAEGFEVVDPLAGPADLAVSWAELSRLYGRLDTQLGTMIELARSPQPVWVRSSDRITTPAGACGSTPTTIAEASPDRLRVTVINAGVDGSDPIYIVDGHDKNSLNGTAYGFPIKAGAAVTLGTKAPIAAFCPTGSGAWACIIEFVGLDPEKNR